MPQAPAYPAWTRSKSTWLGATHVQMQAQQIRARSEIERTPFAILLFPLTPEKSESILARCEDLAGFDSSTPSHVLGWWSEKDLGAVLLKDTSLDEAVHWADQMMDAAGIDQLTLHSSELTERRHDVPGITLAPTYELFGVAMPRWKRAFDIVVGGGFCLAALPLLIVMAALVKLTSRGPAFFLQSRMGKGGKPFKMYKLRSMYVDAEQQREELEVHNEQSGSAFKMTNDPRVTPMGRLLRASSLDELPQLFNVVEGTMSMVGPRPLPVADWYPKNPRHIRRHDITPGISCTWQISGRAEIPFDEWMEMDLSYVAKHTLLGDAAILVKTVVAVLSGRGAA